MPIYGQRALDICHPYITDIRRYTQVVNFRPKTYVCLSNHTFSRCKMDCVDSFLNNKTIILLNLAEYRLILSIRRNSSRLRRKIAKYTHDRAYITRHLQWILSPDKFLHNSLKFLKFRSKGYKYNFQLAADFHSFCFHVLWESILFYRVPKCRTHRVLII